jgi:RND family efflux transporter MFP subunit
MFHKFSSKVLIVIPLVLSILLLAGCGNSKNVATSSGTGVVTETTMTDTVESSGSVSPYQLATLAWGTSGTVSEVAVNTDQVVKKGDNLMTLDSASAPANVIQAIVDLVSAKQALEDAKTSQVPLAEAEVTLASAKSAYNSALGKYYTLNTPQGTANSITILKAQVLIAQNKISDLETQYNRFVETPDTDTRKAQAAASLAQARIDLRTLQLNLNYYESNPDALNSATITANKNLAKAQLDNAQRAYDRLKNGDNSDAIISAQAKVDAAQATVDNLNIIAPFDGEVVVVNSKVGDLVAANNTAAVVVNRSKLSVDVYIDETTISSVKIGNPAVITFDAIPDLEMTGKVTFINPIGTSSSGVVNYTVRVELDKTDPSILIGATASVTIKTGDPKSVLFVPVSAVQNDAQGEYVIRINSSGAQERVTVVSGQIVDDKVVVVGDLKAKDIVQLYTSSSNITGIGGGMPGAGGGLRIP